MARKVLVSIICSMDIPEVFSIPSLIINYVFRNRSLRTILKMLGRIGQQR